MGGSCVTMCSLSQHIHHMQRETFGENLRQTGQSPLYGMVEQRQLGQISPSSHSMTGITAYQPLQG
jgi:hypothetical protein